MKSSYNVIALCYSGWQRVRAGFRFLFLKLRSKRVENEPTIAKKKMVVLIEYSVKDYLETGKFKNLAKCQ